MSKHTEKNCLAPRVNMPNGVATINAWSYEQNVSGLWGLEGIRSPSGWICFFDQTPLPEDAYLIAAAPDLLEALEAAIPMLHTGDELPLSYYKKSLEH